MPYIRQLVETRDSALSELAAIAADLFDVPIALVSLLDGNRQVFVGRFELDAEGTPIEQSFAATPWHRTALWWSMTRARMRVSVSTVW
jgi:hypothetical protein